MLTPEGFVDLELLLLGLPNFLAPAVRPAENYRSWPPGLSQIPRTLGARGLRGPGGSEVQLDGGQP